MCGPASLKIVLGYYGIQKSEQELAELVGVTRGIGADDKSITRAAETLGFKTLVKNESDYSDVENWLSKGVPVILNWLTRGRQEYPPEEMADGHYSVVSGLDDEYIYLQDPEVGGPRKIARDDFMKVWFDFTGEFIKADELVIRQMIVIYK
jgi:ABC-type bacteriocin/lantibiotic exporter with double-glycine peptidase domain